MHRGFATNELLIRIFFIALSMAFALPILGDMRQHRISTLKGTLLLSIIALLWIVSHIVTRIQNRRFLKQMLEDHNQKSNDT